MKKLNRNILFSLGTLGAIVAPIATVVACNDSKKGNDTNNTGTTGKVGTGTNTNTLPTSNSIVSTSAAYDAATNTIDLEKINNQFELATVLSEATALNKLVALSKGFDATNVEQDRDALKALWTSVKDKFSNVLATRPVATPIKIKMGTDVHTFNFDINSLMQTLVTELNVDKMTQTAVAAHGNSEILAGAPILSGEHSQLIISALMQTDKSLAMDSLMKLTHLPDKAFEAFKGFVNNVQASFLELIRSTAFDAWIAAKKVEMKNNAQGTEYMSDSILIGAAGALTPSFTKEELIKMFLGSEFLTISLHN